MSTNFFNMYKTIYKKVQKNLDTPVALILRTVNTLKQYFTYRNNGERWIPSSVIQ